MTDDHRPPPSRLAVPPPLAVTPLARAFSRLLSPIADVEADTWSSSTGSYARSYVCTWLVIIAADPRRLLAVVPPPAITPRRRTSVSAVTV